MEINKEDLKIRHKIINLDNEMHICFDLKFKMYALLYRNDFKDLFVICEFMDLKDLINYTNIRFKRYDVVIDKDICEE